MAVATGANAARRHNHSPLGRHTLPDATRSPEALVGENRDVGLFLFVVVLRALVVEVCAEAVVGDVVGIALFVEDFRATVKQNCKLANK